ncbi:MAG: hypothetical protein IK043_00640, partial [Candidatus Methanomethylophilaceae archaeon]|nr:hypothetical protein [Candidatus Methanomethylophilaceae archaeon]
MNSKGVVLKVESSYRRSEKGLGRVRISTATRAKLGVDIGDVVEIVGKKSTAGKIFKDDKETEDVIYMDAYSRECADVGVGDSVRVIPREKITAQRVTLAPDIPNGKLKIQKDKEGLIRQGLNNRPIIAGDKASIPNIFLSGDLAVFTVISTVPAGVVCVTEATYLDVMETPAKGLVDTQRM